VGGKDYTEVIKNQPGLKVKARKIVPAGDAGTIQEAGAVCCLILMPTIAA